MYPTSPTTYLLPYGDKIRVSSNRRFILVRQFDGDEAKPFIVKRSDSFDTLYREYNLLANRTDYIIDQADHTVRFWFNGRHELHSVSSDRSTQFLRVVG